MRTALGLGFLHLLTDDVIAQVDAFVADKDRGAGNQFAHFMLAFATSDRLATQDEGNCRLFQAHRWPDKPTTYI